MGARCYVLGARCWVLGAGCWVLVLLAVAAAPARAQEVEFRGFLYAASEKTEASETFDAVLGSDRMTLVGGGGEAVVRGRWMLRAVLSQFSDTGTRVFVDTDRTIFPLDIPLEVTVRPLDVSAGYRFLVRPRWGLFAGAGFSRYEVIERSNDETARSSGTGWHVLGGVDVKPRRWLLAGADAQWTRTEDIFTGGAAEALGEPRLGGLRIAARLGVAY